MAGSSLKRADNLKKSNGLNNTALQRDEGKKWKETVYRSRTGV